MVAGQRGAAAESPEGAGRGLATGRRESARRGPPAESAAAGGSTGTLTHASEGQGAEREVHDHVVGRDTPAGRAVNHPPDELRDRARPETGSALQAARGRGGAVLHLQ